MQARMEARRDIGNDHIPTVLNLCRPPKPRKYPQQSRSKMLVKSIQQACFEVFEGTAADRVTMSLIAQRAGVTKGSIYQYFNGIDSVIGSIYERVIERAFRRAERSESSKIVGARLAKQLVEFDALFARSYYQEFYRHTLAANGMFCSASAYAAMESA